MNKRFYLFFGIQVSETSSQGVGEGKVLPTLHSDYGYTNDSDDDVDHHSGDDDDDDTNDGDDDVDHHSDDDDDDDDTNDGDDDVDHHSGDDDYDDTNDDDNDVDHHSGDDDNDDDNKDKSYYIVKVLSTLSVDTTDLNDTLRQGYNLLKYLRYLWLILHIKDH